MQRGDVLYGRVVNHVRELLCIVKVQAAVGPDVRDLFDADIKVSFLFHTWIKLQRTHLRHYT